MEAREYVFNESAGRVQGMASTPLHDFPVDVTRFHVVIDSVNVDNERIIKVTIPVEGITTNHERRDKHMFEGVLLKEKHPGIYFEATSDVITPREVLYS